MLIQLLYFLQPRSSSSALNTFRLKEWSLGSSKRFPLPWVWIFFFPFLITKNVSSREKYLFSFSFKVCSLRNSICGASKLLDFGPEVSRYSFTRSKGWEPLLYLSSLFFSISRMLVQRKVFQPHFNCQIRCFSVNTMTRSMSKWQSLSFWWELHQRAMSRQFSPSWKSIYTPPPLFSFSLSSRSWLTNSLHLYLLGNRYSSEIDIDFVRKSVRAIGICAVKIERASDRCVDALMELIQTKVNYVVQESIIVIKVRNYHAKKFPPPSFNELRN